jgi:hypothetical protein
VGQRGDRVRGEWSGFVRGAQHQQKTFFAKGELRKNKDRSVNLDFSIIV